MSLRRLLTHTVTVKRATAGTGIKKTYQQVTDSVRCLIQPLDAEAVVTVGQAFNCDHKMFVDYPADIREGDQLVDQLGRAFSVRGVRRRNYGNNQHLEVLIAEDKRP